jgi:hypothetical protein
LAALSLQIPLRRERKLSGKHTIRIASAIALGVLVASCMTPAFAFPQGTSSTQTAPAAHGASQPSKTTSAGAPSAADIAAARASGKVWVNLDTGIYHKGGRWYGKTKNGRFMSEADAKAAGYKASQRN